MKLKIAICDDDAKQREFLAGIAAAWAGRMRHLAGIRQYATAKAFLFDYDEEKDFDILLLDVEMPEMSGVELAKRIRQENKALQIVFITGYYEYFSDGFDVSALHYLLKPVDGDKLCPVLDRAVDNLASRQRCVLVADREGSVKVSLADIIYIESENVYVAVHTLEGIHRMRMSLGKFSEQLDETFFKVHRSFVVNLNHIRRITRSDITMTGGDLVPMSRGMYGEVYAALAKFL